MSASKPSPKGTPKARSPRGVRVPQQARSRRTRQGVLEAAVACFEQHGYDDTTTAGIARRARIAVGTLYSYFPDKRAILLELLDGTMRDIVAYVLRELDPEAWRDADPRERTRDLINAVFHARTFQPGMQRILWERYFKDPDFRAAVEAIESEVRAAIEHLVDELRPEGRVRIEDSSTAAFVIYTAIEWSAARLMLGDADPSEIQAAVDATSDMISRFLFPDA